MKKTLILIAAVLLIAGLFIACSADINSADETASVSFGNGAKALTYTTTADLPDVNSLIWWYKATKSGDSGAAGTKTEWTRITSGTGFASLTGFKIGSGWTFTIAGKEDAETDTEPASGYTDCVYYGTNDAVTLRRGNNTININLNWVSPTSASVSFSDIVVYESENEFPQDTNYDTWQIWENEAISGATGTLSSYESTISYNLGSVQANEEHTYIVKVFDYQGSLIASQPVTIYAYPGSTITVTGNIDELNVYADVDINANYNDLSIWKSGASAPEMMSLSEFAQKVNDGIEGYSTATVVLNRNVNLTGEWTPIGNTSSRPFRGTFDGNNKTISNLKSSTDTTSFGLFNYVAGSTIIKNFTVVADIESTAIDSNNDSYVAAIYAHCDDPDANVIVERITVNGSITGKKYVAGLIAQHDKGTLTIIHCTNNAEITCSGNKYAAGILGRSSEYTIGKLSFIDITNTGHINAGSGNAGGICSNLNHKYTEQVPISLGESKKWSEVVTEPSFEYTDCNNTGEITGTSGASQLFRDCSFTLTTAAGYAYYVPRILQVYHNNIGIDINYTAIDIYRILEGIAYETETEYVATAGDAHFTSIENAIGFTNLSGGSGVDITLLTDITDISTQAQIKTNVDLNNHQLGGKPWISAGNITISNGSLSKLRATTKVTLESITFTGTTVGNSDGADLTIDPNNLTIVSGTYSFNPTTYLAEGSSVSFQDNTWIVTNDSN